jgi:hypothetical protein
VLQDQESTRLPVNEQDGEESVSMKIGQKPIIRQTATPVISWAMLPGIVVILAALTGPVPSGGGIFIMLALTLGALVAARPAIIKSAGQHRKTQAIPVKRRPSVQE